jgi:hypothetical protein
MAMTSPISGTNVAATVTPFTTSDTFPTHDEIYGKGGFRTVASSTERDALPTARRSVGMLVFVQDDQIYQLTDDLVTWSPLLISGGPSGLTADEFTATSDGAQTRTYSTTPSPNTTVYINGLIQQSGSFTISGDTVSLPDSLAIQTDDYIRVEH